MTSETPLRPSVTLPIAWGRYRGPYELVCGVWLTGNTTIHTYSNTTLFTAHRPALYRRMGAATLVTGEDVRV